MIDDEEVTKLLTAFQKARGPEGFTEEEANHLVNWAKEIIFNYTLYTLVLDGLIIVDLKDGEVQVNITEAGIVEVEKNLSDPPPQSNLLQ